MGKQPAFQFYPGDWIQDTRILTPLTRGIWMDMLCFMWRSNERGKLEMNYQQYARLLSCQQGEAETAISELSVTKIADVTECNGFVTVINRRMYREERERKLARLRVRKFRETETKQESNASVTPPSSSSSSSSVIKRDKSLSCLHQEIVEKYNDILSDVLPRAKYNLWKGSNSEKNLQARWREDTARQNIGFWEGLFVYVRKCPFLIGEVKGDFRATLHWIVKKENFIKIMEGNYEKR